MHIFKRQKSIFCDIRIKYLLFYYKIYHKFSYEKYFSSLELDK